MAGFGIEYTPPDYNIVGLFQKIVLADGFLAQPAELVYDGKLIPGALDAWTATLAFSGQIFCDFAG